MAVVFDRATVEVPGPGGAIPILRDVDLELGERRVSIIGANGSGKSTLVRLVNGLRQPTQGRVMVDGLDPATDRAAVRRRVGFLFTDPAAQTIMPTPREDIELSLRYAGVARTDRRERAAAVLARWELDDLADISVYELSGGQRQLLALASVLAVDPAIVVMDEPTTLLDLSHTLAFSAMLATLDQQCLIVTHDLALAAEADRTILVDDGAVTDDGEPGGVVAAYREMMLGRFRSESHG